MSSQLKTSKESIATKVELNSSLHETDDTSNNDTLKGANVQVSSLSMFDDIDTTNPLPSTPSNPTDIINENKSDDFVDKIKEEEEPRKKLNNKESITTNEGDDNSSKGTNKKAPTLSNSNKYDKNDNEENQNGNDNELVISKDGPPRKWLIDRIDGKSKYNGGVRPPFPCCWVPPCVKWCPGILEDNAPCRALGKIGFCNSESNRHFLMNLGLLLNLCAFFMMVFSCLAISDDYELLKTASFGKIVVKEITGKFNRTVEINIGLTAVTVDNAFNPDIPDQAVIVFDHFCDAKGFGLENYMNVEDCDACNEVSKGMVSSSIISVITFLPTIFTDILRMHSGYDVNCQKCFGTVIAFVSIISALVTIQSYTVSCSDKFYNGVVILDSNFNALAPDEDPASGEYFIEYDHTWNNGFTLLVAGTFIKFFDIIFHILIATPTITRKREEQEEYEKIPEGQFV